MEEVNPLKSKIRVPKIYLRLPSGGRYNKQQIHLSNSGELPIRAMTARDELLIRNPDALLNGDAVEKLINSCVPEIQDVRESPVNDTDIILLAIKYATYGDKFEFTVKCPKCDSENKKTLSIRSMLDSATDLPQFTSVTLDDGCELFLRPYSFENSNKASLMEFDSKKRLQYVQATYSRLEGIDPAEIENAESVARKQMADLFISMADFSLSLMIDSITQINVMQGEVKSVVSDKKFIEEYVNNLDPSSVDKIKDKLKELSNYGVDKKTNITCIKPECSNIWETEVGFDQSNFFAPTSEV